MSPEAFLRQYESALATQQWAAVAPLIHPRACVTFSTGQQLVGKKQVQAAYERNFALIEDEQYAISEVHWVEKTGDYAVYIYTFHWQGLIEGRPASGAGRGTAVLARRGAVAAAGGAFGAN